MVSAVALVVAAALVAAVVVVRGQSIGYDPKGCGANTCGESDSKGPICFDGTCVECNPTAGFLSRAGDCLCGLNEYCDKDVNSKSYAKCRPFRDPDDDVPVLEQACDSELGLAEVRRDANEALFCGKIIWNGTNSNVALGTQWTGSCVSGKCILDPPFRSKCNGEAVYSDGTNYVYAPVNGFGWPFGAHLPLVSLPAVVVLFLYCCFPLICIPMGIKWAQESS